jgi:CHAT domain-containing protein
MRSASLLLFIFATIGAHAQQPAAQPDPGALLRKASGLLAQAQTYRSHGVYTSAETLYKQVLDMNDWSVAEPQIAAHKGLALIYQATGRRQEAFNEQTRAMSDEQAWMTRRLEGGEYSAGQRQPVTHESQMRAYSARSSESLEVLVSMAAEDLKLPEDDTPTGSAAFARYDHPTIKKYTLAWTLLRKGIILDTFLNLRKLGQGDAKEVQRLRELRTKLSALALNPPPGVTPAELAKQKESIQDEIDLRQDIVNLENISHPQNAAMVDAALQVGDLFRFSGESELDRLDQFTSLPPGTALVEFLRARVLNFQATRAMPVWKAAHYYAFVRTAGGRARPVEMVDLGDAAAIDIAIQNIRRNILAFTAAYVRDQAGVEFEKQKEAEYRDRSGKLYDLVFAPLRSFIGPARTVYIAPDSELNRVSFEALAFQRPDRKAGYLIEDYRFAYLSSGRDMNPQAAPTGRGTVVFADPDYDLGVARRQELTSKLRDSQPSGRTRGSLATFANDIVGYQPWPPLHASAREAELVQQELGQTRYGPVERYLGDQALEERLLALQSPRILHIATHGFFLADSTAGSAMEDPLLRSGILLAGANTLDKESRTAKRNVASGWVTAEDIMSMDLRDTELVVLSGCDTGLGDIQTGEGVFGLRRAFLYAGARNLLVSLYKVPDDETIQLMSRFYQSLMKGTAVLDSFHDAQLALLNSKLNQTGVAHPFYWASFVLVGASNYLVE